MHVVLKPVASRCVAVVSASVLVSSAASAGLTWDFENPDNLASLTIGVDQTLEVTGASAMNAITSTFGDVSISISAATASGFTASMITNGGDAAYATLGRFFSVSDSVEINLSGNATSDVGWRIYDMVNLDEFNNPIVVLQLDLTSGLYSEFVTLTTGQYAVELSGVDDSNSYSGTFGNFAIVPAPSALAILGMAGFAGLRRRR